MQAREPRLGASTGARTSSGAADGDRRGGLVRGLSSFAAQEAALSPVQLKPDPNGSKPKRPDPAKGSEGDGDARLDALAAGLEEMKARQAASDERIGGLEKKVGEQSQTIEDQKKTLDAHDQKSADQDRELARLRAENDAQAKVDSALAMTQMITLQRSLAIDKLQLEVMTAPPTLSETLRTALEATIGAFFDFATGALGKAFAAFLETKKPLVAGLQSGLASLVSAGLDEGVAAGLADPDKPDALFLAMQQAARVQTLALLPAVQNVALAVTHVDDPMKAATALHDAISRIVQGAYQVQYDATIGAYYQTIMASDAAEKSRPRMGPGPVDPKRRDERPIDGLLVIEALFRGATMTPLDYSFSGAKTDPHDDYVRTTPIGMLRVPTRVEITAGGKEATLFRDASGRVSVGDVGSRLWLAELIAADGSIDIVAAASRANEKANEVFGSLASKTLKDIK